MTYNTVNEHERKAGICFRIRSLKDGLYAVILRILSKDEDCIVSLHQGDGAFEEAKQKLLVLNSSIT